MSDAVDEARQMVASEDYYFHGQWRDAMNDLLTHINGLEAENAALRKAIERVEASCEDTTDDSYDVNGKEWTDGYDAMLDVVRAALMIAQTDERKAETE